MRPEEPEPITRIQESSIAALSAQLHLSFAEMDEIVQARFGAPGVKALTKKAASELISILRERRDGKAPVGGNGDRPNTQKKEDEKPGKVEKKEAADPAESGDTFALAERKDEEQIALAYRGEVLEDFFYTTTRAGKEKAILSWAGVKEVARQYGGIQIKELDVQETETEWRVRAVAYCERTHNQVFGVSSQTKELMFNGKTQGPDQFAFQKAVSKAQRNAIRALLPEVTIAEAMNDWIAAKKRGQ